MNVVPLEEGVDIGGLEHGGFGEDGDTGGPVCWDVLIGLPCDAEIEATRPGPFTNA